MHAARHQSYQYSSDFYQLTPTREAGLRREYESANGCADSQEPSPASSGQKPMKILLVLPAGEHVRVTHQNPAVPRRAMLRFSVLPLTTVAALTPREQQVRIVDENVEALDFDTDCDVVGITFMTALAPRAYEIAASFRRRGQDRGRRRLPRYPVPGRRRAAFRRFGGGRCRGGLGAIAGGPPAGRVAESLPATG